MLFFCCCCCCFCCCFCCSFYHYSFHSKDVFQDAVRPQCVNCWVAVVKICSVLHFYSFGIIEFSIFKCWELSTA
jgi:hypothetical protein